MRQLTIGEKIKYFRKGRGLSQLELELELNTSPGRVSRIESGKVIPTRQSILRIAQSLGLSPYQLEYLDGSNSYPVSKNEVQEVAKSSDIYFKEPNYLAYLTDDRGKIYAVSIAFLEMLKPTSQQLQGMIGTTVIEVMLNPELGVADLLDVNEYENLLYNQLNRFYEEAAFIKDDQEILTTLNIIKHNKLAAKIWSNINKNDGELNYQNVATREVVFNIGGQKLKFIYNRDNLLKHPRFELVEYLPSL
jgi:transcriptional regulator with XRE-family HTH domain